jgi:hypothetical protein
MKEKKFWNWFLDHKLKLEEFVLSHTKDYSLYEELTNQLRSFNEHVIPELTVDSSGNYILVLSCDGIRDGIEFVERLYNSDQQLTDGLRKRLEHLGVLLT